LPESLAKENRRDFDWKRANPIGALLNLKKYPTLLGLIVAVFFYMWGVMRCKVIGVFYHVSLPLGWKKVGISLGAVGLLVGIVQGGLIRFTSPRLGNEKSIYIGLALYTLGMLLFAFATQSWMMFVFLIPYCLGGIAGPALQSVISGKVPANEQGEIQGTLASLMSASAIVGPPMMTNTFYFFTHKEAPFQLPGAPFILGGFLMLVSTVLAYYSLKKHFTSNTNTDSHNQ